MTSPLGYLVGQEITWIPTATFKSRYALVTPDNTTIATIDMSNWSSKAIASVPEGPLFLRKEGFSGMRVAIYTVEQGPLIATFQRGWTGTSGQLQFADGRVFKWGKTNFWGTQKAWMDQTGNQLYVQFSSGGFSRKATVVIEPQAPEIPDLSLLLVLGFYNILLERRDSAVAASVAASV